MRVARILLDRAGYDKINNVFALDPLRTKIDLFVNENIEVKTPRQLTYSSIIHNFHSK
jgi:hypothetical protein